jgi:hypothetical protein
MLLLFVVLPQAARAEWLFDAGIRESYEDNINGSPTDAERLGDRYSTLFVSLGRYQELTEAKTYLVLKAGIEGVAYEKYEDLNGVQGMLSVGLYHRSGEVLSYQFLLKARGKDYRDDLRDSISGAAALEIIQHLTERFWLREGYEYERNEARDEVYAYEGHNAGVWAGLTATPRLFFGLGISSLQRAFDDPGAYRSSAVIVSFAMEYRLSPTLFASLTADHQRYTTHNPAAKYDDNVLTIGLTYSY